LVLLSDALVDGEVVHHLVQGNVRGLECVVARTDRRVVVAVDRPNRPLVESLHPTGTQFTVTRSQTGEFLNIAVIDQGRQLEVVEVRDFSEAAGLATPPTQPGYF
jgi:hypothetical protein